MPSATSRCVAKQIQDSLDAPRGLIERDSSGCLSSNRHKHLLFFSSTQKHHCFMALKKRTGRWAEKLAVDAEPGLTTAQLMVRTSSRRREFLRELPPPPACLAGLRANRLYYLIVDEP